MGPMWRPLRRQSASQTVKESLNRLKGRSSTIVGELHVCGGEPSHMLVWPDYVDNCQQFNVVAAYKVIV